MLTDLLWEKAKHITQKHLNHPFSLSLAKGSLSLEIFKFYLQQDALYIKEYARAMRLLAHKAPTEELKEIFLSLAQDSYELEEYFQKDLFLRYDIKECQVMQPACLAYTSYLLSTISLGSFIQGLTSLLPCFWVYLENGKNISRNCVVGNPYQGWIDTYVSPEFIEQTELVKHYVNFYSINLSQNEVEHLADIFLNSCRLDLQFMDDAYHQRKWSYLTDELK